MKIGRFGLNLMKTLVVNQNIKRRKYAPPHIFKEFINIPYIEDGEVQHSYDVYLAKEENRKNCCVIDIHGGAFIFCEHQDNYPFGYVLLEQGYDVMLVDYIPNDGNVDTIELVKQTILNIKHFLNHLQDYGLENDRFVIAGDSAGGYLALLISEAIMSKEVASNIGIDCPELDLVATILNCPVYDFEHIGDSLSKSGRHRMIGPRYNDLEWLKTISPKTYIKDFNKPIFLSTCKNDFIRSESLKLYEDIKDRDNIEFLDIQSDDKNVDHVYNVTKINLEESKQVNNAIGKFIEKYL